jgi:hypothetical protein
VWCVVEAFVVLIAQLLCFLIRLDSRSGACCASGSCSTQFAADCDDAANKHTTSTLDCAGACGACCALDGGCVDDVLEQAVTSGAACIGFDTSPTINFLADGTCAADCEFTATTDAAVLGDRSTSTAFAGSTTPAVVMFSLRNDQADMLDVGITFRLVSGGAWLLYEQRTLALAAEPNLAFESDVIGNNGASPADGDVYLVLIETLARGATLNVTFPFLPPADASGSITVNYEGATENYSTHVRVSTNARKRQAPTTQPFAVTIPIERREALRIDVSSCDDLYFFLVLHSLDIGLRKCGSYSS